MKSSIKGFFSKYDQIPSFLRKKSEENFFTEEIRNGKLHFLCSYCCR